MARGLPDADARALLMEAFIGEVIDGVQHDAVREQVHAWVSDTLRSL
jgi:Fe-S cluster assembly protein SufD